MTDNEIIKALECCSTGETYDDCEKNGCPLYLGITMGCKYIDKENQLYSDALDLINRQKAELEAIKDKQAMVFKLSEEQINEVKEDVLKSVEYNEREIKAEAYKEFASKVKQEFMPYDLGAFSAVRAVLKDLTGEDTNDLQIL